MPDAPDATITYRREPLPDAAAVARLFDAAGLRRPTQDLARIGRMLQHADLVLTAWHGAQLVGIARALTDFSYCCYLSDLAVDRAFQRRGIGGELLARVRTAIGDQCNLLLLSAPEAVDYYPQQGFAPAEHAFLIRRAR